MSIKYNVWNLLVINTCITSAIIIVNIVCITYNKLLVKMDYMDLIIIKSQVQSHKALESERTLKEIHPNL